MWKTKVNAGVPRRNGLASFKIYIYIHPQTGSACPCIAIYCVLDRIYVAAFSEDWQKQLLEERILAEVEKIMDVGMINQFHLHDTNNTNSMSVPGSIAMKI